MSKLYDKYLFLKDNEPSPDSTLFLFKSGIFFIFLDSDAKIASNLFHLKLTCFVDDIVKCGFPVNSLDKYLNMAKFTPYKITIIEPNLNEKCSINQYQVKQNIEELLSKIASINTDTLSIREAYDFIDNIKLDSKNIIGSMENGK